MMSNTRTSAKGWLSIALPCPSPNFNQRPQSTLVNLLVIHNISLPPSQFGCGDIEAFFCNKLNADKHTYFKEIENLQVSAHFLITRTGLIIQFVSTLDRAWHAGRSTFCGVPECNDYSIGIELEGCDHLPFSAQQYTSLTHLTHQLQSAHSAITQNRIIGHSDIAPGRKSDPGPCFNWKHFKNLL